MNGSVSAIVLNYNGAKFIEACLESLRIQDYGRLETIVVDNASTDDSLRLVREHFPEVGVLRSQTNSGFSAGMNRGIRESSGDYLLLLNTDVVLAPDYVSSLVRVLHRDDGLGGVTGKVYRMGEDDPKIIDGTGHEIYKNRLLTDRGEDLPDTGLYLDEEDVFGVCAGMSMYRRAMLEDIKIGNEYFDEDFFLFLEDVDLDWRAQLRGWRFRYVPRAIAYHHRGGVAKRRSVLVEKHNYKNRYFVLLKNDSWAGMLLNVHHFLITDTLKTGKLLLRCPAALLGWYDFWRSLPSMIQKRRYIQTNRIVNPRQLEKTWFKPFNYRAWISKHMSIWS